MSNKDFNNLTSNITTVNGVQYRLRRVIDKTATNIHHIISRKEKQDFNVHDEHNKIRVNMIDHDNLNQFFKDKQNPKKQLEYMVTNRRGNVLSAWVKRALYDILSLPNDVFYRAEVIKGRKNKNKKTGGGDR